MFPRSAALGELHGNNRPILAKPGRSPYAVGVRRREVLEFRSWEKACPIGYTTPSDDAQNALESPRQSFALNFDQVYFNGRDSSVKVNLCRVANNNSLLNQHILITATNFYFKLFKAIICFHRHLK
jgi:hypothetical protein